MTKDFKPMVMLNHNSEPLIVFGKGRLLHHVVVAGASVVTTSTVDSLRGLRQATYRGDDYPVRKAASFYLNHSVRSLTKRAKLVLKSLVARQPKSAAADLC